MKDDYLWDKSGEPDPQIQQLEDVLGTLRYQPKPLRLTSRRNYFPLLAIAATVVIALLTAGLWLQTRNLEGSIPPVVIAQPPLPIPNPWESVAAQPFTKRKPRVMKHNRKEALAAKQQLMFALRLASEKLNSAHQRTQDKRSSYENTLPN